jgi:hypothetical protein
MRGMRARPLVLGGLALAVVVASTSVPTAAEGAVVTSLDELRRAAGAAAPGTRIRVAPGVYEGGVHLEALRGTEGKPIVVEAEDVARAPVFRGGGTGLHLSRCSHVEVRGLEFEGQTGNGLNVDDGGRLEEPSEHVTLSGLVVRDVGPRGNCDGIKLSGLRAFRVEKCVVERWGDGGSAIDMVGCRDGVVAECRFRRDAGPSSASGVQAKGGSRDVVVRRCRFENAGARAVNAGGSTGLDYFRPPLAKWQGPRWEAKDLVVEGCTFVGSEAAVAFVGVDGATFRFNTVVRPGRWAFRVLQETRVEGFVPSRGGVVADNLIVFRSDAWSEGGVNRGGGTDVASFRFERNAWCCEDRPERTKDLVRLPTEERDGIYGVEPAFLDLERGEAKSPAKRPLDRVGAHALPK